MAADFSNKRKRYTGKAITIKVGENDSEEFTCHDTLLKNDSDFFRAALDRKWREGQTQELSLPENNKDIVAAYVSWLYDGKIESLKDPDASLSYDFYVKQYIFGEKIQSSAFCNDVADAIIDACDNETKLPGKQTLDLMYDGTSKGSPGRALMVQITTEGSPCEWLDHKTVSLDTELAIDLLIAYRNLAMDKRYKALAPRKQEFHKEIKR